MQDLTPPPRMPARGDLTPNGGAGVFHKKQKVSPKNIFFPEVILNEDF